MGGNVWGPDGPSGPTPTQPLDPRTHLRGILDTDIVPELERLGGQQKDIEALYTEKLAAPIDYDAYNKGLTAWADSYSQQLYGPGGAVEMGDRASLSNSVDSGFGGTSGGFDNARNNTRMQSSRNFHDSMANQVVAVGQQAMTQRSNDLDSLLGYVTNQGARRDSLAGDLFAGTQGIELQKNDRETMELNRRMIEKALSRGDVSTVERLLAGAGAGAMSLSTNPTDIWGAVSSGIGGWLSSGSNT